MRYILCMVDARVRRKLIFVRTSLVPSWYLLTWVKSRDRSDSIVEIRGQNQGIFRLGFCQSLVAFLNTLQLLWEILFRKWLDCRLTMIVRCCSLGQLTSNNLICSSPLHLGWPVELYVCVHSLYACESVNGAVLVHRYKKELQRLLIR